MRTTASFATALAIAALTCAPAAAQRADSALVGSWSGQASISAPGIAPRTVLVRLDIKEDASVTGSIGDAQLVDARLILDSRIARAMRLGGRYAVNARLSGALVRADGVQRERVHISLDRRGPTLVGDLQTSGNYEGNPSELVLTAKELVLQRAAPPVSRAPARGAAPATRGLVAMRIPTPR
jgi:hypothetical protein